VLAVRPSGRFLRDQRIRGRAEFREIQQRSQRVVLPHFVLLLRLAVESKFGPRLGVTASRKVGSAVVRNRVKRLVREAFRATRQTWPNEAEVVVIVRRAEPDWCLSEVIAEWVRAEGLIRRGFRQCANARGETVS
jgi:ribonuclease P protein component